MVALGSCQVLFPLLIASQDSLEMSRCGSDDFAHNNFLGSCPTAPESVSAFFEPACAPTLEVLTLTTMSTYPMLAISPRSRHHTILQAVEPNFCLLCYLGGGVKLRK